MRSVRWASAMVVMLVLAGAVRATPADAVVSAVTAKNLPNLTEGTVYPGLVVGSFTGADVASSYSAIVAWGDGTTSDASVADDTFNPGPGKFLVFISPSVQTPPYADEGSFPVAITVFDGTDRTSATSMNSATATVAERDALTFHGVTVEATAGKPFSGTVATVTNTWTGNSVSDFTATVNWGDGSGNLPAVLSGSGGSFTVSGSHTYSASGTFSISVAVRDDAPGTAFVGSLGSSAHVVDPTTTGVSSSANPGVSGQSLVFNALVSHTSGSAVPTGSVAFSDGSTTLGTVALSAGAASFSTSTLAVGDHTITAAYTGDSNYAPSSGSTVETVTAAPIAAFSAPKGAVAGSPTGFDGSPSTDPDGTIAGYSWDFGDGSTAATGATPMHTFAGAGTYAVRLTVTDNAGITGSATHEVAVGARGSPLTIIVDHISPRALLPDRGRGPSATSSGKRGAQVTFTLSRAARVVFTIQRKVPGRKVGRRCVAQTRSNARKKKCSRLVVVSKFTRVGVAGSNGFHFTGRANRRPLPRGSYVLRAVATDAAGTTSKPASRPFRTVK